MKRRKPSKQERQSRMTLTLTLSGCVFVVTLVTLLIIGAALLNWASGWSTPAFCPSS